MIRSKKREWWEDVKGMTVTFEFSSEYVGRPVVLVAEFSIQVEFAVLHRMASTDRKGWVPHQAKEAKVELIKRLKAISNINVEALAAGV